MISKVLAALVIVALVQPALTYGEPDLPDAPSATRAKLEEAVAKYAREHNKVNVRLTTNTMLTGRIQEIEPEHFIVANPKTGQITRVSYNEVAEIRKAGLSKGTKILIGVGIAAGVLVGVGFAVACSSEGGPHC